MARHKNGNWDLLETQPGYPGAQLAVLMDIRDELQTLNRLLACPNFLAIPRRLEAIRKNTAPKREARKT